MPDDYGFTTPEERAADPEVVERQEREDREAFESRVLGMELAAERREEAREEERRRRTAWANVPYQQPHYGSHQTARSGGGSKWLGILILGGVLFFVGGGTVGGLLAFGDKALKEALTEFHRQAANQAKKRASATPPPAPSEAQQGGIPQSRGGLTNESPYGLAPLPPKGGAEHAVEPGALGVQLSTDENAVPLVIRVRSGMPAERAGITAGDTIVSINGRPVSTARDVTNHVRSLGAGAEATVAFMRGAGEWRTTVTLTSLPKTPENSPGESTIGADFEEDAEGGVRIKSVASGSPAERSHVSPGDTLRSIDGRPVATVPEARAVIAAARPRSTVVLILTRNGERRSLWVTLDRLQPE